MKKSVMGLLALVCCAGSASAQVIISQIYGGGGNTGAPYNQDFVELRNTSSSPVVVPAGGWSLQYASATSNWASSAATLIVIPAGTVIPANGFFLIGGAKPAGGAGADLPVAPDINPSAPANFNMSAAAGKVALVSIPTSLNVNNCTLPTIIDYVTFGNPSNVPSCNDGTYALLPAGTGNFTSLVRLSLDTRCQDSGSNGSDFVAVGVGSVGIYNSASDPILCPACIDCNNNGICDDVEINVNGGTGGVGGALDCNSNGLIDTCEIASNPNLDCDFNGVLDSCQIAANPALDCDVNGVLDSCQIAANPFLDSCNNNGQIDSCETPGPGQDCNGNGVLDCHELKVGILTDADANGTPDQCEGAVAIEATDNATVQNAGIRAATNGNAFFNVQGAAGGDFASYGALRFNLGQAFAALDALYPGGWTAERVYIYMQQANAAFTFSSLPDGMQIYYTNLDGLEITVQNSVNPARQYPNFASDWTDRDLIRNYTFTRLIGTGPDGQGSGTIESYLLFDAAGSNNSAAAAVGAEANRGDTSLTLLINTNDDLAAATYAGRTNNLWRGPSIVIFASPSGGTGCEPDFNQDGNVDQDDIACLAQVVAGDASCSDLDPDFNGDGNVDQDDIDALAQVVAGSPCP